MKKISLLRTIQNIFITVLLISAIVYLTSSISSRYKLFTKQINLRKNEQLFDVKALLKSEVKHVVEYIAFLESEIQGLTRVEAKSRVEEAHKIATHLHNKFKGKKTEDEIREIVIEALRPIRFDNGNGYYFIIDLSGVKVLFPDRPEMEDKNLITVKDMDGKEIIKDMINIIDRSGEGFYKYRWSKPKAEGKHHEKLDFVKRFQPYDWLIGTGIYLDDIEKRSKEKALKQASEITFGENNENYVFIGTYEGISLNGPGRGKNMIEIQDSNGVLIVQELINNAKKGGGFVEYVMPKFKGVKPSAKISYSKGIEEWGWYIGAGMYIDDIDRAVKKQYKETQANLMKDILVIVMVTFGMLLIFLVLMRFVNRSVGEDILIFNNFFRKIAENNQKISRQDIKFEEFDSMAEYANRMLFEKISAEKLQKKSEDQFRMLFSEAPIGIVLEDKDLNISISNGTFQNMIGYGAEELKGMNARELSLDSDMKEDLLMYNELLKGDRESYSLEKRFKNKDGKIVWGYITRTIVKEDGNFPLWSIVMIEDLTERKQLQDQMRQAEKMETIGQLAGGIAHDFNNQLAGIMGFTELLNEMTKDNLELQKYTQYILNSVKNSAELTSQLLAFARKGKIQSISVDMHDVVFEVVSLLKHSLPKKIEIHQELNANPSTTKGDPAQIQNAVLNLAINARDAMDNGGEITFTTEVITLGEEDCLHRPYEVITGEYVQVKVSDTGVGMEESVKQKIFEPFFTTKELGKGTGMGLAAVYGTVKNHKGYINVESELNKGTTFSILFPLYREDNAGMDSEERRDDSVKGEGHILLVDDEEMLRNMGSKMLQNLGYIVNSCSNGEEAVKYYKENWKDVDLIIMDMVMPVMGGREAFLLMKDINPDIKVVLASGYSLEGEAQELLDEGVKGLIQKPFRRAEFSQEISRIMKV